MAVSAGENLIPLVLGFKPVRWWARTRVSRNKHKIKIKIISTREIYETELVLLFVLRAELEERTQPL